MNTTTGSSHNSAAGFKLESRPGGTWRVHLHTVPLWYILTPWALLMVVSTCVVVNMNYSRGEYYLEDAIPFLIVCYVIIAVPLLFASSYLYSVMAGKYVVEYNLGHRTINLPRLPYVQNPKPGRETITLDQCTGIRVTPWDDKADSLEPWNPNKAQKDLFTGKPVPARQYRLEMCTVGGASFPFALYFPGSNSLVRLKRLQELADWFNSTLQLSAAPEFVAEPIPQEAQLWSRPLPLWQNGVTVLAGIATAAVVAVLEYFIRPHISFEVPVKFAVTLIALAAIAVGCAVDASFRKSRSFKEKNGESVVSI